MAQKIVDNLILGDMYSAPEDSDLVIGVAEEVFWQKAPRKFEGRKYIQDPKHVYYDFEDYPDESKMDHDLIADAIKQIENNIKTKKVYIHCVYGINRSASTVFMFLVRNNKLKATNVNDAMKEFRSMYHAFGPNPGWREFLVKNYPYDWFK